MNTIDNLQSMFGFPANWEGVEKPNNNFFLLAGPCVAESEDLVLEVAETVNQICKKFQIPFIFKASYKKANRSRVDSFTGMGMEESLQWIQKASQKCHVPTVTDIHTEIEAAIAAEYVDVLQIPAFLCRQTDLLVAAGKTGKYVNIKKGQFVSAESMSFAVEKVRSTGNNHIMLTERGTTFGYHDLIVDMRNFPEMKACKVPAILDVTHSLQQPNQSSGVTGGKPHLIETLAKSGLAAGANGLFIETHPNPSIAKSDGANMLALSQLENLMEKLCILKEALNRIE
jgi:2-dehydro-3-deoxyphosphooctonate aldolase (KDO 8-P synthase)